MGTFTARQFRDTPWSAEAGKGKRFSVKGYGLTIEYNDDFYVVWRQVSRLAGAERG